MDAPVIRPLDGEVPPPMSIFSIIMRAFGPNPHAAASGLTSRRTGFGRYEYSGTPADIRSTSRPAPDRVDLAVMRAAGMEPTAAEIVAANASHRCPSCGVPSRRRFPLDADQRCWSCWVASPDTPVVDVDDAAREVAKSLRSMRDNPEPRVPAQPEAIGAILRRVVKAVR